MSKPHFVQITRQPKVSEKEFKEMMASMFVQMWENLLPPQMILDDLTGIQANNVITPATEPIPDCLTCGACCVALPVVGVYPEEQILPEYYWDITIEGEKGEIVVDRFLKRNGETFACTALDGTLGEKVSCGIYEQRPRICRGFEAVSDKCHALRRVYGFEPNLSLMDMYYAVQKQKAAEAARSETKEEIRRVNFVEEPETGDLQIIALMKDGTTQIIHTFNPKMETWRQFEFTSMPFSQAKKLIESRQAK